MGKVIDRVAVVCAFALISGGYTGSKMAVGSPASFIRQLDLENTRQTLQYTVPTSASGYVDLKAEDFHHEDGYLSMWGAARDFENSDFMIKGDEKDVYGWVVLRGQDLAYEYTTDAFGTIVVEQVPVEKIFPVCNLPHFPHEESSHVYQSPLPSADIPEPHIGDYDGSDVRNLQSRPSADKVIYLDIRDVMNGDSPFTLSKEGIWETWQSLASGLSMFDVNVTTDHAVYTAAGVANSAIDKMLNQSGRANCGVNIFGSTRYCNLFIEPNGYGQGRTALHEMGHGLGLLHDGGDNGGEYFLGFSTYRWTPIMGNFYPGDRWGNDALYQWSKGEYTSATRTEDDLNIINRHLDYREDDIVDSRPIIFSPGTVEVPVDSNWGQIARNTDVDVFTFQIGNGGGRVDLRIDRIEYLGGSMLDVEAELRDATGNLIASANADAARYADLDEELEPGLYELHVMGGSEGTPSNGFSNYSSLGFYGIEGSITGAINDQLNNSITASGPGTFCQGDDLTLSAADEPGYTFQWYRDGVALAGSVGRTLNVDQPGGYYVMVSDGENTVSSSIFEVEILNVPGAPQITGTCLSAAEMVLTASGESGGINWYGSAAGDEVLFTGDSITVDPGIQMTYYAAATNISPPVYVGPEDNTFGDGGTHGGDFYLVFDAHKDLTIKSVKVYADGAGDRLFVLYDGGGDLVDSRQVDLPDGESRAQLDFQVPQGAGYQFGIDRLNGQDVNMYRNNSGPEYPYEVEGLISITSSSASEAGYYYYAYHWEIQESGTVCASERVSHQVNGCVSDVVGVDREKLSVAEGPGSVLNVYIPHGTGAARISLYDASGSRVYHRTLSETASLDMDFLGSGVYRIKVVHGKKQLVKTLVLR